MNSFTWRLTLWFSLLVTLTTAGLLLVGGWLLHRQLISSIETLHTIEGEELLGLLPPDNLSEREIAHLIATEADSDAALFFIQVHHQNGQVLFRSDNLAEAILPSPLAEESHWTAEVPAIGTVRISEFRRGPWHIQVATRLAPVWRVLRDYTRVSAMLVVAAAAIGIGVGYGFSRLTLRPVRAIETTARRIRGDNLGERIAVPPGNDELAALARLLNQMFDRLEAAFSEVQQFTANASHELKTPLTLIRLNADKLHSRVEQDPEATRLIDDLNEEVRRLHQIIESLLFLSKADSGLLALQRQVFSVPEWLRAFAEDAQALAEDRGSRFEIGRNDPGELSGEPHLLRHLLLNLVSNALAAAPRGGVVRLDSRREAAGWIWSVADEGPGLPPDDLERIFERFVRAPATVPDSDGARHGLGLAICRSIVRLHGGSIRAENRTDRSGLRLVIELPDGDRAHVTEQSNVRP